MVGYSTTERLQQQDTEQGDQSRIGVIKREFDNLTTEEIEQLSHLVCQAKVEELKR